MLAWASREIGQELAPVKSWLTSNRCHTEVSDATVEEDERQSLLVSLVGRGLVHSVPRRLEVAAADNLQSLADVDDKRSRLVGDIVPRLVATPDLEAADGHGEQLGGGAKVGVAVHPQSLGRRLGGLLDRAEESVTEVALACWRAVRLHVFPQVVVLQLEDAREQGEKAAVDRGGKVLQRQSQLWTLLCKGQGR